MLLRTLLAMSALFGVFLAEIAAATDFSSELVERGKRATALLIQKSGRLFGSAICIDDSGLFVTNAHVVGGRAGDDTTIVINSGTREEKLVRARVLRIDRERDLALLHATDARNLTSLALSDTDKLFETQPVAAFGYPFGTALAQKGMYPNVSVNVGRVTALRRQDDAVQRIQFDAQVNPGNSGGPLVDTNGNVVGVVVSGIVKSGVYMAIPASILRDWLRDPVILVEPRQIEFDRRHDEVEFTIRIIMAGQTLRPERVEFSLGSDGALGRTQEARAENNGKYAVTMRAVPIPAPDRSVHLSAMLKEGYIRGYTSNPTLKIGCREIELSEIKQIERDAQQWRITTSKDEEFTANSVPPIEIVIALDDAVKTAVGLRRISQLAVYPHRAVTSLNYRVAVAFPNGATAVQSGEIPLIGHSAAVTTAAAVLPSDAAAPKQATAVEKRDIEFKLPAKYAGFAVGGHGRYLIFQVAEPGKALVFDVTAGRVVHEMAGISSADLLAAGADKLFVVSPDKMIVQRFSLENFQREKITRIEAADAPTAVHLGSASKGPLLLQGKTAQLLDTESLRPVAPQDRVIGATGMHGYTMHVSADGRTFSGIASGSGGVSHEVMQLRPNRRIFTSFAPTSQAIRWSQPTADGTLLLLPGGEVYSATGRKVHAPWLDGGALVPSEHPAYFLDVRLAAEQPDGRKSTKLTVCTVADCRAIHSQWGFDELTPERINSWHDIVGALRTGHQWRIQYAPWTNTIVTLPRDNERIVVRQFDLERKLSDEDKQYLYLLSTPPLEAITGQAMRYQLQARSNGGNVHFTLEDGPLGTVVSRDGLVSWDAPETYGQPWARFVVSVRNEAGQELLHSFEVAVRDSIRF